MSLIDLKGIRKSYTLGGAEVPILHDVTFSIEKGAYVALMGSSGSGKSTLMNILGFLDRPSGGSYKLDGQEVSELSADERAGLRNSEIGFIFQSFNLLRRTSALENVMLPLTYATVPVPPKEAEERAMELLERVGLGSRIHHIPSQLSGGQQQRVAIARALIMRPRILLADEPTGNLDSHTTEEILRLFEELNSKGGITIIIVTHEAEVGERTGRVIRLRDGRVSSEEKTSQITVH